MLRLIGLNISKDTKVTHVFQCVLLEETYLYSTKKKYIVLFFFPLLLDWCNIS